MERLECDPKTLQPISKLASTQYFSEIESCRQTILNELDLLRVDDTVSCLIFQQSIDTSLDILLSLIYNFFQRRYEPFFYFSLFNRSFWIQNLIELIS